MGSRWLVAAVARASGLETAAVCRFQLLAAVQGQELCLLPHHPGQVQQEAPLGVFLVYTKEGEGPQSRRLLCHPDQPRHTSHTFLATSLEVSYPVRLRPLVLVVVVLPGFDCVYNLRSSISWLVLPWAIWAATCCCVSPKFARN